MKKHCFLLLLLLCVSLLISACAKPAAPKEAAPAGQIESVIPECLVRVSGERTEDHIVYRYQGAFPNVEIPGIGCTLHLPDEWTDEVTVYVEARTPDKADFFKLVVANPRLIEEMEKQNGVNLGNCLVNGILTVCWETPELMERDGFPIWVEQGWCEDGGISDGKQYAVYATNQGDPDCDPGVLLRKDLISVLGQQKYDELVGELTCTPEEAMQMFELY